MARQSKTLDDNTATVALTEADPEDFIIVRRLPTPLRSTGWSDHSEAACRHQTRSPRARGDRRDQAGTGAQTRSLTAQELIELIPGHLAGRERERLIRIWSGP